MQKQLTIDELRERIEGRLVIETSEVRELLQGSVRERQIAARALFQSLQRESLEPLAWVAEAEGYSNQETITRIQDIADRCEHPIPALDVLSKMGIHAAKLGANDDAIRILQAVADRSWAYSQLSGTRVYERQFMNYMHDAETDAALALIASRFQQPAFHGERHKQPRLALFTSCIIDENSPSMVTGVIARSMRACGYEVIIVSSEFGDSTASHAFGALQSDGFQCEIAPGGSAGEKIAYLTSAFERIQADIVLYAVTPMDYVAKIVSAIGMAPAQCILNMAYEHHCGKFDYVLQTTSIEQEQLTAWPGKSKYIGSFAALQPQVLAAAALRRAEINVNDEQVVFLTHGRVSKCSDAYIAAARRILESNERAVLVLAGSIGEMDIERLNRAFSQSPAARRIILLGAVGEAVPSLLKTCDVYLDPFPWPGGQSTLEAMWAGLPIVSMQAEASVEHSVDTRGPIGSATDAFLPEEYRRAEAGNIDEYADLALEYANDVALRRAQGAKLRAHVAENYSIERFIEELDRYLKLAIRQHEHAAV